MALSDFYESTILKVSASFGFFNFDCDPNLVSAALRVTPDELLRKGEIRATRGGHKLMNRWNSWHVVSRSDSKDVNVHLRELLARVDGCHGLARPEFGRPSLNVTRKGNYLYAGNGPFYEADVIAGIASWAAELWQDIYQIDQEENPPVGPLKLRRIPKPRG
jgi:hypothetical protein